MDGVRTRKIAVGDVLHLTRDASPQFARPIVVRVIRLLDWPTYQGWAWVDAYELGPSGDATRRRSLYVRTEGVRWLTKSSRLTAPRRPLARTGVPV